MVSTRFAYRGVMVDSSRHFLPVPTLEAILDGMAASALNVLHWHLVDARSFPWNASFDETLVPASRGRDDVREISAGKTMNNRDRRAR